MKTIYKKYCLILAAAAIFLTGNPLWAQHESIYFVQALKTFKACNYKGAKEEFTQAINFDEKTGEAYAYRARCAIFLGDFDMAQEDLTAADALIKNNAQLYLSYGYLYNEMKDYKKAMTYLDNAVKLDPKLAEAFNARGVSKQSLGDHRAALEDYTQAIKIDNKYALAYNNHGAAIIYNQDIARASKWDLKNALYDFVKALDLDSSLCIVRRNKAMVHKMLNEDGDALREINQAIRCDPQTADNYLTRAIITSDGGRAIEDVLADYNKALSIDPNMATAYIEMARYKARNKRYDEAFEDLKRAEEIAPQKKGEIFYFKAIVSSHKGKRDDMIHYLQQAKKYNFFDNKIAISDFKKDNDFAQYRSWPDFLKFQNSLR